MADMFAIGLRSSTYLFGALLPVLLSMSSGITGIIALGFAHLTTVVILLLARSRIGGITGDVLGFIVETGELAVLLTFTATFSF